MVLDHHLQLLLPRRDQDWWVVITLMLGPLPNKYFNSLVTLRIGSMTRKVNDITDSNSAIV
jgi:hypothetical protein